MKRVKFQFDISRGYMPALDTKEDKKRYESALSNVMAMGNLSMKMHYGKMPAGSTYTPDKIDRALFYAVIDLVNCFKEEER